MEQLEIETGTWKRLLDFFTEENIHSKNRLSAILKDRFERNLLEELENFQGQFIKQDEVISLLRSDITELRKLLLKKINSDGITPELIERKVENIRHNLSDSERRFCELQFGFSRYLSQNIS
ncbi:MAG: hypothetical protein ABI472_06130 [Ginsengibacter sp.]